MPYPAPSNAWLEYRSRLPKDLRGDDAKIPGYEETRELHDVGNYVPSEGMLDKLRSWLVSNGQLRFYYFLTETAGTDEQLDFLIPSTSLDQVLLLELNRGAESVLTGCSFEWAISVDHEGRVVIGGSADFVSSLT